MFFLSEGRPHPGGGRARLARVLGRCVVVAFVAVVIAGRAGPAGASAVQKPPSGQVRASAGTDPNLFLISPTALDFGSVPVGTTSPTQAVTVTNVSGSPILMNGTGGAAGVFGGSQDCQGHTLAAGASCHMHYAFTPTAVGPVTGGGGTWNGQEFRIADTGTGIASTPAPVVTEVVPNSGPAAGGTTVTITGTGFRGVTSVSFGPVLATTFSVVSSAEITAVSPAQSPSLHNILVTTATGGTSVAVATDQFTYLAPVCPGPANHPLGAGAGIAAVNIGG